MGRSRAPQTEAEAARRCSWWSKRGATPSFYISGNNSRVGMVWCPLLHVLVSANPGASIALFRVGGRRRTSYLAHARSRVCAHAALSVHGHQPVRWFTISFIKRVRSMGVASIYITANLQSEAHDATWVSRACSKRVRCWRLCCAIHGWQPCSHESHRRVRLEAMQPHAQQLLQLAVTGWWACTMLPRSCEC